MQIVTYNSADAIEKCLDSVLHQTFHSASILVIDNASDDSTRDMLKCYSEVKLICNAENVGYSAAHNVGFNHAFLNDMDYVLTLNPDVTLTPDYLKLLVLEMEHRNETGGIIGKMLRVEQDQLGRSIMDSTGLIMQRFFHVRDRDAGISDFGQRNTPQIVWGVCGAAALYRTGMLKDILQDNEVYDESFFVYKEDVDLCWRARRRNWTFRYIPNAVAFHRRSWVKGRKMPALVVAYSFANQIALLIRHSHGISTSLISSAVVELLRYLGLFIRRPNVALATAQLIRCSWSHHLRVRGELRQTDIVKERTLYDIGHPSNL